MDSIRSMVFTKIQNLEPQHASKIMGFILIRDPSETEMFGLAFGPESLLQSIILQAKSYLHISSNTCSTSSLPTSTSSNPVFKPSLNSISPSSSSSLSYAAAVLNNGLNSGGGGYGGGSSSNNESKTEDLFDSGFEMSMMNGNINNNNPNLFHHRRSVSLNDACYGGGGGFEDDGGVCGPCTYFTRGFCRNGGTCGFKHGGFVDSAADISAIVGSPTSKMYAFEHNQEVFRSRAAAASQLLGGGLYPFSPRSNAPLPMMVGDEFNKVGRSRSGRSNFSGMGLDLMDPNARQIYLTFPADSTFVEDDVSNYFSIFGPVQDVRIPYQQKRMFGFVTFVYPETVKLILAKGNPHFVCDSRVLVKPYKDKGNVEKKHYQHHQLDFDRGELSSPREPFEIPIGPRMYYNTQELMLRRKLENQVDLQQALELQSRRMINLQLEGIKNQHSHQNLSTFNPISMRNHMIQNLIPLDGPTTNHEISQDNNDTSPDQPTNNPNGEEEDNSNFSEFDLNERLFLPDSLFS